MVTGKPYARLLNQCLFRPLGMRRTFLNQRGGLRAPLTQTYGFLSEGSSVRTTHWSISWGWAAGGVASTLQDGHRWAVALGTGQGVLSPQIQAMRAQHCAPGEITPDSTEVMDYCLGVIVVKNSKTGEVICYWHNGGLFEAEAWLGYYPQTGASLVILANGRDETDPRRLPDQVAKNIETGLPDLFRR